VDDSLQVVDSQNVTHSDTANWRTDWRTLISKDAVLRTLVEAWPALPLHIRAAIEALARTAKKE
jgi:hypothetical protein